MWNEAKSVVENGNRWKYFIKCCGIENGTDNKIIHGEIRTKQHHYNNKVWERKKETENKGKISYQTHIHSEWH